MSDFPTGGSDEFYNPTGSQPMDQGPQTHSQMHTLENEAIDAVETALTDVFNISSATTAVAWGEYNANASGGAFTVTLPAGVGKVWVSVTKTDSSPNAVTVACNTGQMFADGSTSVTLGSQNVGGWWVFDGTSKWTVRGVQPGAYVPQAAAPTGNSTVDTATLLDAFLNGKQLQEGTYAFNGTSMASGGSGSANVLFIGPESGQCTITIPAGDYLIDDPQAWLSCYIKGIKFSGGAGVVRLRYTGTNVSQHKIITGCQFSGYTVCAVQSNASDEPYWDIQGNDFDGDGSTTTTSIGIALAGEAAGDSIANNGFSGNRIDVKLAKPGSAQIIHNDFIPGTAGATVARARVWLVPSGTTAHTTVIDDNKFGNENISASDQHIIIADEGTGTYVGDRLPVLNAASTGNISNLTVTASNRFEGNATASPAPVFSTANGIYGGQIAGALESTFPAYIVQFYSPSTGSTTDRWVEPTVIGPIIMSPDTSVPPAVSNGYFPHCFDPAYVMAVNPTVEMPGIADAGDYSLLTAAAVSTYTLNSVTASAITDAIGGTDAATWTYSAGGQAHVGITPTIGKLLWIEFDAEVGPSSPLTSLEVQIVQNTWQSGGDLFWRRSVKLQSAWTRYRFPVILNNNTSVIIDLYSATAGEVNIGRIRCYHGRAPVPSDAVTFASGARIFNVVGVPPSTLGNDGDFAFRSDGTVAAHTVIYHKEAGAWAATGA